MPSSTILPAQSVKQLQHAREGRAAFGKMAFIIAHEFNIVRAKRRIIQRFAGCSRAAGDQRLGAMPDERAYFLHGDGPLSDERQHMVGGSHEGWRGVDKCSVKVEKMAGCSYACCMANLETGGACAITPPHLMENIMDVRKTQMLSDILKDKSLLKDKCYIDGKWVGGAKSIDVTNPVNEAVVGSVPTLAPPKPALQ